MSLSHAFFNNWFGQTLLVKSVAVVVFAGIAAVVLAGVAIVVLIAILAVVLVVVLIVILAVVLVVILAVVLIVVMGIPGRIVHIIVIILRHNKYLLSAFYVTSSIMSFF